MDILVICLVILLAIVIFVKREDKKEYIADIESKSVDRALELLSEREYEIVHGAYNSLPKAIRDSLSSKIFADIVGLGLSVSKDVIKDKFGK